MSTSSFDAIDKTPAAALLPRTLGEALLHVLAAFVLIGLSISALAVSTMFGVAVTFLLTLGLCTVLPASAPITIVTAFMFQNMFIAMYTPIVPGDDAFDSLRGSNFVILMTAYGAFLIASFQVRLRAIPQLRPWLLAGLGLLGMFCFYLGLGALNGEPKDAIVYFRNTVSPLACFHIALVAASLYRIEIKRPLLWLGSAIVAYGYLELIFTLDFLSIFNGNLYIERNMRKQIETGVWEKALQQTGFVFRGLEDAMTTKFFNTPFFGELFPLIFRIGGPNFHPISFAYALSILSVFFMFNGRKLLPLAALPLLLAIGSKGAMVLFLMALFVKIAMRFVSAKLVMAMFLIITAIWIGSAVVIGSRTDDFHALGFLAGIRDFASNPLGRGLGLGGNLSSTSENVNWQLAQATGSTEVPMESAVGVMLYQLGISSLAFFGFLVALAALTRRMFLKTGDGSFMFAYVSIVVISANAVLQEEAFYSPLALGLCLTLVGLSIGGFWRERQLRLANT